MDSGWIRLSRRLVDHWIWSDAQYLKWWLDIVMMANWEDRSSIVAGVKLKVARGQLIASAASLAARWGCNRRTSGRFLKLLADDAMIRVELLHGRVSVISISDYGSYCGLSATDCTGDYTSDYTGACTGDCTPTLKIKEEKNKDAESVSDDTDSAAAVENYSLIVDFWNEQVANSPIPRISSINPGSSRRRAVAARVREFGQEKFLEAIIQLSGSAFLKGDNKRGFVASFDWFVKPSNFPKVLEGNFTTQYQKAPSVAEKDAVQMEQRESSMDAYWAKRAEHEKGCISREEYLELKKKAEQGDRIARQRLGL